MKNMWGKELAFPEDVYYSEELLWVKDEGVHRFRVGICDVAVKSVKELLFVDVAPRPGAQVAKGEILGYVETSKGVWEIVAPLSGTLVTVNPPIAQGNANPIVDDPYGKGWLIELETAGDAGSELQALRKGSEAKTREWLREKAEALVPLMDEED